MGLKVATVLGTRPEIIRLSRVMAALDRYTEHTIIHTGQSYDYELNQVFFDELEIRKPDIFLQAAGKTAAETIGLVIAKSDEIFMEIRPDAVLLLGDTNSCLAAIAAKRRKIPVFHMEAGNRCFDDRVPEEINRRIVDHTSDINLPYSDISREYLLREGFPPDRVIKTGSPMFEVLHYYIDRIERSNALSLLQLVPQRYFLVSCHREENLDGPGKIERFVCLLNRLAKEFDLPILVSTHPRTRRRLDQVGAKLESSVKLHAPLGFFDYVHLQMHARATLSDSGTISEESGILGFPALNLRDAHERPEAMEEALVMMVGFDEESVLRGLRILESQRDAKLRIPEDYKVPNVSEKVLRIIQSYVGYVNRVVWRKEIM